MLRALFLDHPRSVGETYGEHQRQAFRFAGALFVAAVACVLHGLVPRLCTATASRTVRRLNAQLSHRAATPAGQSAAQLSPHAAE